MTEEELQKLNEAFSYPFENMELIRFLTCLYNTPAEIDPNEVFYNGAGGFVRPTDEERDYLAANGYNMSVNWREKNEQSDGTRWDDMAMLLRVSVMDDILMRRLGITLSEVEMEYGTRYFVEWVPEYDAFFKYSTDTNVRDVLFQTGVYIGDDTYVVDYQVDWIGILRGGHYRVTFTMTNNDPDTIMFISNVKIA